MIEAKIKCLFSGEAARTAARKKPSKGIRPNGYVVCLRNSGYPASLEMRKIYVALADEEARAHGLIRVIDESGEDYLYASDRFVAIEFPRRANIKRLGFPEALDLLTRKRVVKPNVDARRRAKARARRQTGGAPQPVRS